MSQAESLRPERRVLARPMWLAALPYALVVTVAVCWPLWPGHFGYDSLYAYEQSLVGIDNMTWPPMHAYLFYLSRAAGAGAGGLFALQTFLIFLAAGLGASLLIVRRGLALAAMLAFAIAFVAVPPLLGILASQWRDVPTGSFAIAGLTLWLLAARYRSVWLLIAAAVAAGFSVALRYNAFPLFVLAGPLMVWRPFLGAAAPWRARTVAAVALTVCLGLAWASTQWRLPDFKRVPAAATMTLIQLFDLFGVSACSNHSYVPLTVTDGWPLTPSQIREAYDPRHAQMAFREMPHVPRIQPVDANGQIQTAWRDALRREPGCYLAHRAAVFVEQVGLLRAEVFYPVHGGIDRNSLGLRLSHPGASQAVSDYVRRNSPELWRRPFLLYIFAGVTVAALFARRDPRALWATAVLGGAYANVGLLFLIGPAADARYIFPSNVLCAFLIATGWPMILDRWLKPESR